MVAERLTNSGLQPATEPTASYTFTPETINTSIHPLQAEINRVWRPLLGEESNPASRVLAFREKAQSFSQMISGLNQRQLDGNMPDDLKDEVAKQSSYVKIAAIDLASSYGIDIGSYIEDKMLEKMQEKYPPDAVTELRTIGYSTLEAMAYLKYLYSKGEKYSLRGIAPQEEDAAARLPRNPALKDVYQDVADTWQRSAFGSQLRASERIPNLKGELQELLDEFSDMGESSINSITDNDKIDAIAGEIADVVIAVDGYTAAIDRDQAEDSLRALDRMREKYGKASKLRKLGMDAHRAILELKLASDRREKGKTRPSPIAIFSSGAFGR